jgi:hypothetical protein
MTSLARKEFIARQSLRKSAAEQRRRNRETWCLQHGTCDRITPKAWANYDGRFKSWRGLMRDVGRAG